MGIGVAIVSPGKVAVEGGHDGIFLLLVGIMARPLADARAAGIGQHHPADLFEGIEQAIPFCRVPDRFRARGNGEFRSGFQFIIQRHLSHRSSPCDIFVG